METTFNNIFNSALESALVKRAKEQKTKEMRMETFLKDMEVIKKNLESAFINTPIKVEMGMFGIPMPEYTTIHIQTPKKRIGSIVANSCPYHCANWSTTLEEKDLRLNGIPWTYDKLIELVAIYFSEEYVIVD